MFGRETDLRIIYYVATDGNDDNPGTETEPFRTIEKARDTVRRVNQSAAGDIVVWLRGGTYVIEHPLVFDSRDSGINGRDITYGSYPGECAVISGGKKITGWKPDSDGRWKASVEIDNFRQLYVNGRRAVRTRRTAPAGLKPLGIFGYASEDREMANWTNPSDIEFCYYNYWCHTRCRVKNITVQDNGSQIEMAHPDFTIASAKEGVRAEYPAYIENVFEFLDKPGEWYLNRETRAVYYIPMPGEKMDTAEVIAPVLERLLEVQGTLDAPVHNLQFHGLTFVHATWLKPSNAGLVDIQANFTVGSESKLLARDSAGLSVLHHEHTKSPANIVCRAAQSISFERCRFTMLGGSGLDLEYGARDNLISGCEFHDISGTAIQIGDVLRDDHHPTDERLIVKHNTVTNNYIHQVAVEYQGGVGIFAGYTEGTVISHNELCNLPYSGVSVGWGWGELDPGDTDYCTYDPFDVPTPAKNNIIENNHIHHVMMTLDDGAGIYTLGRQPGTVIRGNHIHDSTNTPGGIYLDEGSVGIEVTSNIVYEMPPLKKIEPPQPLFLNRRNLARGWDKTCSIHDNFFDMKPDGQNFPCAAAEQAGLEPEYRDLLGVE